MGNQEFKNNFRNLVVPEALQELLIFQKGIPDDAGRLPQPPHHFDRPGEAARNGAERGNTRSALIKNL